jgi:uncharacterized protein (DUF58 family)
LPIQREHIEKFSGFELIANQIVEGFLTGLHKSPFHGFSVEFAEHKLYVPGDSIKNIDWKLFARTEKLFLKEYEEETNLKCSIAIDISFSMSFPEAKNTDIDDLNKLGFSIYSTAALLNLLSKQRDAAGVITFDENVIDVTEIKGSKTHFYHLINTVEKLLIENKENNSETKISNVIHQIAERLPRRSLFVLFTDFHFQKDKESFTEITESLHHLKHNNHEVVVFHVLDESKEIDLNFSNTPHKFIDLETGELVKINPKEIKDAFQATQLKNKLYIKKKLSGFKIDYVEADINDGFSKILQTYLLKRAKLF